MAVAMCQWEEVGGTCVVTCLDNGWVDYIRYVESLVVVDTGNDMLELIFYDKYLLQIGYPVLHYTFNQLRWKGGSCAHSRLALSVGTESSKAL